MTSSDSLLPHHSRHLLDGIDLFKPIAMGIRHLSTRRTPPPLQQPVFRLWCDTPIKFGPDVKTEYEWDCESCYENYHEFMDRR